MHAVLVRLALGCSSIAVTPALAADALTPDAIRRAEWSRDRATLLEGPFQEEHLPLVARSLGRLGDARVLDRLSLFADQSDPELRKAAYVALGSTPGGASVLRPRLDVETEPMLLAAVLWGLGRAGHPEVDDLIPWVGHAAPVGPAASEAIGVLARGGVDATGAVPALVAALGGLDARRVRSAAWALSRIAPETLLPAHRQAVGHALDRAGDDDTVAWLAPVWLRAADASARRTRAAELIAGPYRHARVAVLSSGLGGPWDAGELSLWASADDPWLAATAERLAGVDPPASVEVDDALDGATPKARSEAAARLLEAGPEASVLGALLDADDPVVRELAVAHLGTTGAWATLWDRLPGATSPPVRRAALTALTTGEGTPPDDAADRLAPDLAGPFGHRHLAHAVAQAWDVAVDPPSPVDPWVVGMGVLEGEPALGLTVQTTQGTVHVAFEPEAAPLAVAAFTVLARRGDLDGHRVHRVVPGFVVQTGDPRGDGMGGHEAVIPDEVDDRPFDAGSVGLATAGPDTGTSQWFVTTGDAPHLAGRYTRFGRVTAGLDVVRRLGTEDRIVSVTVERAR